MDNKWKEYWSLVSNPKHPIQDQNTFNKYSEEILFYLKGAEIVVDTGCGSGEILEKIAPYFKKIYGIDFSESMIDKANERCTNFSNVILSHGNMLSIKSIVKEKVDCIYNNGVIQYLSLNEVEYFVDSCLDLLNSNGKIVIMNIPDRRMLDLYGMGFYRELDVKSFYFWIFKYFRFRYWVFKQKIRNKKYRFDQSIGNWFTIGQFKDIAIKRGLHAEFNYSMHWPYGYRFHCILKKNE
jgi:cyclopropane-fatty-acyl-phospholipid synthase